MILILLLIMWKIDQLIVIIFLLAAWRDIIEFDTLLLVEILAVVIQLDLLHRRFNLFIEPILDYFRHHFHLLLRIFIIIFLRLLKIGDSAAHLLLWIALIQ